MPTSDTRRDDGFTLIAVVTFSLLLVLLATTLLADALAQSEDANRQQRDDVLVATAEAIIDRYASKLTVNPAYYLQRVDESERARTCTDPTHPQNGVEVAAGNDWIDGCAEWAYLTEPGDGDWFSHPLLDIEVDAEALIEVSSPDEAGDIEISVVGRVAERGQFRTISANLNAISLSEFVAVSQNDLVVGAGITIDGKMYAGGNLFYTQSPTATVLADTFTEGIFFTNDSYGCPNLQNGAVAHDNGSGSCGATDIRSVFPEALSFSSFWDDLERLRNVACGGSGLCLNGGYEAYLIHPYVEGGQARLAVWGSNGTPPMNEDCTTYDAESAWWINVHDPAVTWTPLGTNLLYPANGAVFADGHVILGNRGGNPVAPAADAITVKGGLTILAGSQDAPKNLIVNTDITYSDPSSFDVIGMIASDENRINPQVVGSDLSFEWRGAVLSQGTRWGVAQWCGATGESVRIDDDGSLVKAPNGSFAAMTFTGSMAFRNTPNINFTMFPRTYVFDPRLAYLRPPFYPLIGDDWSYDNWSENFIPDWAN